MVRHAIEGDGSRLIAGPSALQLAKQILHDSMNNPNNPVPFKLAQAEANISNVVFWDLSP
jgi:hypothetical protein